MKRLLSILLVFILIFAVTACGQSNQKAGNSSSPTGTKAEAKTENKTGAKKELTMGISYYTTEIPSLQSILSGVKERAEELGYKVVMAEGSMDINKQISNVEDYIEMGCDVILINPSDSAGITPAVEASNKAKIPVVMLDIDSTGGERASHVTSDNEAMGRYGGEYIAWKLNGKGKVALLDFPQLDIVKERSDAFRKVMSYFPDIEIVATELAVTRAQGLEKMENIFQAYSDLAGVFGINDGGGLGAYFAGKAAGKNVAIAGVDAEDDAVDLIKKNTNYGLSTAHLTRIFGRTAAETAHAIVQGKQVPKKVIIPVYPVTYDSLADYPGRDALELASPEKMKPRWYNSDSWKQLTEKYNYTDWKK